jgi:flagellar basal-body rod protein FlgB
MEVSNANKYMRSALNARALRQDMISSNIANIDTPKYRPKDIAFESLLASQGSTEYNKANKSKELKMAKTANSHLEPNYDGLDPRKPTVFYRDGHLARNDGNSVDIDVETTEMAKNSTAYNALTAAYKKDMMIFTSVIEASKSSQ